MALFKIPSLIATLATLSILDGISLTMRPTAQGVISADLVTFLRRSIGPVPIAFIVICIGAGLLDRRPAHLLPGLGPRAGLETGQRHGPSRPRRLQEGLDDADVGQALPARGPRLRAFEHAIGEVQQLRRELVRLRE